jgi:hypothetical protein
LPKILRNKSLSALLEVNQVTSSTLKRKRLCRYILSQAETKMQRRAGTAKIREATEEERI